jgi:phosphohistidine phosphatase SixA
MITIFLTHADAKIVKPDQFRALSKKGRADVEKLAIRFHEVVESIVPSLFSKEVSIGEIFSSPQARCVETVVQFADAIREFTSSSEIHVRRELNKKPSPLSSLDVISVIDGTSSQAVLLCTHGDLVGALPRNATLRQDVVDNDGWFIPSPVLALVEYERKSDWDKAIVLWCGSVAGNETFLARP